MKARTFPLIEAVLLIALLVMAACGGGSGGETDRADQGTKAEAPAGNEPPADRSPVDELPWEKVPLYPGVTMEATAACPFQWKDCGACERRRYATSDGSEAVCAFYQDEMRGRGWQQVSFQPHREGACTGTWTENRDDPSAPRVMIGIGEMRSGGTHIGIILGAGCP